MATKDGEIAISSGTTEKNKPIGIKPSAGNLNSITILIIPTTIIKKLEQSLGKKKMVCPTIIQIDYNNGTLKNHNEHGNSQKIAVKPPVLLISIKNIYLHTMTEKLY